MNLTDVVVRTSSDTGKHIRRELTLRSAGTTVGARRTVGGPRSIWAWLRLLGAACVLAVLVWQVGTGPFLAGVRAIDGPAAVAALGIGVATTVCCAWRWTLVAAGLGVRLPLRGAVAAYYRSQFLNATLPGGVIGDVHRAVRHGLDIGDVRLGVRAVVLERLVGQSVQVALAVVVLGVFPSPVRSYLPMVTLGAVAVGMGVMVMTRAFARGGPYQWLVALRRNWVGIVLASTVVMAGHLMTFVLAARTAGSTAPVALLVPLTLLALLAMALPVNLAGWGPREGVAAWVFGAAGLTATQGVTTAVTYGVLAFVASLPGAGVLVVRWLTKQYNVDHSVELAHARVPALQQGGAHG
jgi:uncharacterized membrane protein YbhN (UPF0104 family)